MSKKKQNKSIFLLYPFTVGMIFAINVNTDLPKLTQYGPIMILIMCIIMLLYGIHKAVQGRSHYDAILLQSGIKLIFSSGIGIVADILFYIFIFFD